MNIMKNPFVLLLAITLGLASCASHKYSSSERIANQTVSLRTNATNTDVAIKGSNTDIQRNVVSSASGTSSSLVLPTLKKKNLKLVVTAPDYESVTLNLKRRFRSKALFKSLGLSLFTYGIPLLIDPFRSDFYQLHPNSQSVVINMDYNDAFYQRKLDELRGSEDPSVFVTYISNYPNSPFLKDAIRLKDEVEYSLALNEGTEAAMGRFISTHPDSHLLDQAKTAKVAAKRAKDEADFNLALKEGTESALNRFIASHGDSHLLNQAKTAKDEMEEARLAFDAAQSKNTVESYVEFLERYPTSIHASEAIQGKTKSAYVSLVKPLDASEENVMEFMSKHLVKSSLEMDGGWLRDVVPTCVSRYGNALIKTWGSELEGQAEIIKRLNEFESEFRFAVKTRESEAGYIEVSASPLKKGITSEVKAYYFELGQANQESGGWETAISEMASLFPDLCPGEDHWCLMGLIEGQTDKNGDVIISNPQWVFDYFNNVSERDRMISFRGYQKDGGFVMLQDESDWMRFSYADNKLKEFEAKKNGQTVCRLIFKGLTNYDSDIESAEYFSNGSLIFKQGMAPSGDWFGHVIENGVNVTLSNHPTLAAVTTAMETVRGVEPSIDDYASALQSLSEFEQTVPKYEVEILSQIEDLREQCKNSMETLKVERAQREREEMARLKAEQEERERQRQAQIEEQQKARERELQAFASNARTLSINFIVPSLVSPSSAVLVEYTGPAEAESILSQSGYSLPECNQVTRLVIDSQNRFGATLRGFYFVFFRNGVPCHWESSDSIREALGMRYQGPTIINATLKMNGCGCD